MQYLVALTGPTAVSTCLLQHSLYMVTQLPDLEDCVCKAANRAQAVENLHDTQVHHTCLRVTRPWGPGSASKSHVQLAFHTQVSMITSH